MNELPYQAEYAKSGRAACKGCKEKIDQGSLRIAIMVQSAFHDGKQPNWHHEKCLFKKKCPTIQEIGNFNKLKNEDQKRIKELLANSSGAVMPVEKGKKGKGTKRKEDKLQPGICNFSVEYAKSSRATCKQCDIKICKDEVRISKMEFDPRYGDAPAWHHVKCFAERQAEFLFLAGGEDIPGFKHLQKEDQAMVKKEIKPISPDGGPIKKLKSEPKDEEEIKKEKKLEKDLCKQNDSFHKYRSRLSELGKSDLHELLEANSQEILKGPDECLDHLADMMAFGALDPCPECRQGQLILDTFNYRCTGNISEWTKCSFTTRTPKRNPMKVPSSYKKGSVFKSYKPKIGERLFELAPPPAIIVKKEEPQGEKKFPIPPLKNLQFFMYGKFKGDKEEIKKRILKMGGLVTSRVTDTLAAVVSTENEVEKMAAKMESIQAEDIEVVNEEFFDLIDSKSGSVSQTLDLIKHNNIAPWGSDPTKRVPQDVIDGKSIQKSGSNYVKSSGVTKLKIKGGTAVDPDSGVSDEAHVYVDPEGAKYTVTLAKTDVVAGKNSYYKMQVLAADNKKKFWFFRSWGRIGTPIGGNKLEDCKSLQDAVRKFEDMYMERTENPWEMRDDFMKMPGAYYPIEVDYGDGDNVMKEKSRMKVDTNCGLALPVQNLVQMIFDIDTMKRTLLEFELDTEKMPLGKLSKKQIKSGYNVLSQLLAIVQKGNASNSKIVDSTNRFYTVVPHSFGLDNPPLLDSEEAVLNKIQMLDSLMEIEIAYSLLNSDEEEGVSAIESNYKKLKTELEPLDKSNEEYQMIADYVKNTHAATHTNYTLELQEVFKVKREGEAKRYKPFRKLHNRRLLWHGSRTTNFAGILSQGLRIAPPEAPVTGYMFGKGIYFADMVSKSANYCCTNTDNPVGLMLLSEVALGDMKKCKQAEYITKLPAGAHSVWGMGQTEPDPSQNKILDDGVIVPLGKSVQKKEKTSLLYNEFIVYDVAQVNAKYLLQVKFNYKY
ncbi:poly [ADP-ribose] polymerase isoform X2 [Pieris brassicae]|nr:poly [ADP-ribose] polymerase isoform X2 [Pieris brassicae]XP_045512836.1 poly [ADP-ribose] polymerase isoform X2 [Pieris brassicae]XP_045512837.1 poly [ADP-ribose] polymerase isoform X2 [Pieris brassicae]